MSYSSQLADQLPKLFKRDLYDRGMDLYRSQRVSALQNGSAISASVDDPDQGHCKTFIQLKHLQQTLSIDGECSCDQEFNCAHVVATLLQSLANSAPIAADICAVPPAIEQIDTAKNVANRQSDKCLHYVLSVNADQPALQLFLLSDERAAVAYAIPASLTHPARFLRNSDLAILKRLQGCAGAVQRSGPVQLNPSQNLLGDLMDDLIDCGRCHWQSLKQPPIQKGQPIKGRWRWQRLIDGRQKLILMPPAEHLIVLPLCPQHYLDTVRHRCGRIDSGFSDKQDERLFSLAAVEPEQIDMLLKRPDLQMLLAQLPEPNRAQSFISRSAIPSIHIHLDMRKTASSRAKKGPFFEGQLQANIGFDYPGGRIAPSDPARFVGEFDGETFIRWQRDTDQENSLIQHWQQLGWEPSMGVARNHWRPAHDPGGLKQASFLALTRPQLLQQGWSIDLDDACPRSFSARDGLLSAAFAKSQHPHRFRFSLMLTFQQTDTGEAEPLSINLLKALSLSLQRHWLDPDQRSQQGESLLCGDEALIIRIDNRDLDLLLDSLVELNGHKALQRDGFLELSVARDQPIRELLQSLSIRQAELPSLALSEIDSTAMTSDDEKSGLRAELREYQQDGIDWLHKLQRHRLGGLLADDMGLGKTLQILGFLWQCKCRGQLNRPVLILLPTSLLANWKNEAEAFTPGLSLLILHGPRRAEHFPNLNRYDLVITSYPLLIRDLPQLLEIDWAMLILDEAQAIKNHGSRCARAVREFNADMNICLSGTPLENHLGELWALFDFMLPGLLGTQSQFKDWFKIPIEEHQNPVRQELLLQRIAPVMLRRDKQTVLPQLPPKQHQLTSIALSDEQQRLYQGIEQEMRQSLRDTIQQRGVDGSRIHILNALTRLRQLCCDPRLLADSGITSARHSAKLNHLLGMLDEMLPQGRRILIFSQFTSMLTLLEKALSKRGLGYALLTGKTQKRQQQVERFQSGEVPLFLISLKAGGSGLNLTAADTVIHYDPWWNPAVENQATDRAHRIGQLRSVMVYKLIAADTIEHKIVEMQQAKQLLADGVLAGAGRQSAQIDSRDLTQLLEFIGV